MQENNSTTLEDTQQNSPVEYLSLEEIARIGAKKMLEAAFEAEIQNYLESVKDLRLEDGKAGIVRNGYHKERKITIGTGTISLRVPRTRNRVGTDQNFISSIVPSYMRRSLSIDDAIPLLYLNGISTNLMEESLKKLLGEEVSGLSAANVSRLKSVWEKEFNSWKKRSLENEHYCYIWADGIHLNVRFSEERLCV